MNDEVAAPDPGEYPDPGDYRASDADRERVAKVLRDAMGEGRITMTELDERLRTAYAAKTLGELTPLTSDIPGSQVTISTGGEAAARGAASPSRRVVDQQPTSRTAIAIMSGTDRKGEWVVPPLFNAFAFWGGVEIDLTKARLAEHEVTIQATAIMGGIEIIVPPDITVLVNGVGFMGAFENRSRTEAPPGSPVVRITGLALMGGVEVKNPKRKLLDKLRDELT